MFVRTAFLSCLLLTSLAVQAASTPLVPIHEYQTQNGVRVLWVPIREQPIIDVQLLFHAGSAYDGAQFGLAHLTVNTLSEGTTHLSADAIAEQFDATAALYGASASRDASTLSLRSLSTPDAFDPALATFSAVVNEANFPDTAIARVKNETLQGIASEQQSPSTVASRAFYKNLYGTHPYAHSVIGDESTVKTITQKEVEHFYHQYYTADNALLVIVGDVDETQVKQIADTLVGHLPQGTKAPVLPAPTALAQNQTITVNFPTTQSNIRVGTLGIARNDPDFYALYVGNFILGGGSFASRLMQDVREKQGLSYSVSSSFLNLQMPGPFVIGLQTQNKTLEQALKTVNTTTNDFIAQGPTAAELSTAQKNIIGSFPLLLSSNADISNAVSIIGFYNLPLDYLDQYRQHIAALTVPDIQKAVDAHLKDKKFLTIVVTQEGEARG